MGPPRTLCKNVGELSMSKLEACYLGRAFGMTEVIPRFQRLQNMLRVIANCLAVEELSQASQQKIESPVNELGTWFDHAINVPDNHQRPQHEYEQSRRNFDRIEDLILTDTLPAFSIAAGLESGFNRKSQLDVFTRQVAEVQLQAEANLEKIQALMAAAENSAAQAEKARERAAQDATIMVISAQQVRFNAEVRRHRNQGYLWLIGATAIALSAVGFALQVWVDAQDAVRASIFAGGSSPTGPSTGLAVQLATSKIAVMALLVSFTFWAGRMYRSAAHNQIVNQHRSNALATFETFVDGATPEIRSAVLLQTTACIFGAQPTGLIAHESESPAPAYVADFARAIGTSASHLGSGPKG